MPQGADDASLRHQLAILRRRWFVVVLLAVLGGGTAFALTLVKQPTYQAVGAVRLPALSIEEVVAGTAPQDSKFVATEVEVLNVTRDALVGQLGADVAVSVKRRGSSNVIEMRATSTTTSEAESAATQFADTYVDSLDTRRSEALSNAEKAVQGQIETGRIAGRDVEKELELLGRLQLLTLGSEKAVVVDRKRADRASSTPLRNGALGLGGGLVLGVGLALFLEKVDDRLRRREDLEAAVDLPVVGVLPRVSHRQLDQGPLGVLAPGSPSDEAYRMLRTNLSLLTGGRAIRCLQVTSPTANEGKTTVATTLAVSFAQAGQRVIVVDCDMRQPRVHEAFGLANDDGGLSSVLLGQGALADAITALDDQPRLVVLPAGPVPPSPSDLLATERAGAVLATLRASCDLLLIDTPSVLTSADARVLSRHVDAVLLVARPMRSTRREVARAHQLLAQVGAPIAGTVLSAVLHDAGRAPARPATGARAERPKQQKPPGRPSESGAVELPGT